MAKLMIVDDEQDVREYLKNFFKRRKIDVTTAESAEEAMEILGNSYMPDLMLLDVRMTGMTGIDMLKKIRAAGNQVKVILVTGVEDKDTLSVISELNVLNCLHKPLILEELEKEVLSRLASK